MARFLAAAVLAAGLCGPVAAGPPIPFPPRNAITVGPAFGGRGGVVTACWVDVRYFRNLRSGVVDFCRAHLAYAPGALDCYQFTDRVCSVFLPDTYEWVETRQTIDPVLFECPDGPEPPVCPRLH